MQLGTFINLLKLDFNQIKQNHTKHHNPFVELETYIAFKEIERYIASKKEYPKSSIHNKKYKPLDGLNRWLATRLARVRHTPADYFIGYQTSAEQLAYAIGKLLDKYEQIGCEKNDYLEYVIPTLNASVMTVDPQICLKNYERHQVMLTHDGTGFIDYSNCFDYAETHKGQLTSTCDASRQPLHVEDKTAVMGFSSEVKEYIEAISKKYHPTFINAKRAELDTLLAPFSGYNSEYDYGEEGMTRLKDRLLLIVNKYLTTPEAWQDFLLHHVDQKQWITFLADCKKNLGNLFNSRNDFLLFLENTVTQDQHDALLRSLDQETIAKFASEHLPKTLAGDKVVSLWAQIVREKVLTPIQNARQFVIRYIKPDDMSAYLQEIGMKKSDLFTSRDELFDFLATKLPQTDWDHFLNDFDPKALSQLILQDEKQSLTEVTLNKALEGIEYRVGHAIRDKAIAYCLSPEYWAVRDQSGEYKSLLARLLGSWVAYSKTDKQLALKEYWRPFLLSEAEMTLDGLKAFIKQKIKETPEITEKEINDKSSRMLAVLLDGELGLSIVKPALGEIALRPQATAVKVEDATEALEMKAIETPAVVAPPVAPKASSWLNFFGTTPTTAVPVVSQAEEVQPVSAKHA